MKNELIKIKHTEAPDRWRQFNWMMQILICSVGFVVVGIVVFGLYRAKQLYQKYFPLEDASMEMRLEATTAYLWFEEMLGGDNSKSMSDILKHLDKADWYAKAMIEGGEISHLKLLPLKESQFHDSIKAIQNQLKKQRELINRRVNAISTSGPGSEIDKIYHLELENFSKQAIKLEMDIKQIMARDYRRFLFIGIGLLVCCVFLFSIIGYGFYRYENLRRKSYLKILQMERILVQREKMAALGLMISGIAHEINNPNNFISFNIPILRDYFQELMPIIDDYAEKNPNVEIHNMPYKEFREDLQMLLKNIENGSKRINRIVSDLKEFSRKKDKTQMEWIDIKEVIDRVITICGTKLKSRMDTFEINIAENLPQFHSDSHIIELILINLLNNAAEAADKKNCWIKLNVFLKKNNQNALIIEVSDNGCGINESDIVRIFDPFFSTKSTKGGTGMGLFLCRTLADQIGAHLEVDSEFGKGSTFRLITNENSISVK